MTDRTWHWNGNGGWVEEQSHQPIYPRPLLTMSCGKRRNRHGLRVDAAANASSGLSEFQVLADLQSQDLIRIDSFNDVGDEFGMLHL